MFLATLINSDNTKGSITKQLSLYSDSFLNLHSKKQSICWNQKQIKFVCDFIWLLLDDWFLKNFFCIAKY